MKLTKAKRRRIWRILKFNNWPFNHLTRDDMDKFFDDEIVEMQILRNKMEKKAIDAGYDPMEDLVQ